MRTKRSIFALVTAFVLLGWSSPTNAVVKYGTASAEAALQFDPYHPGAPIPNIEVLLRTTPPIQVTGAAALAVPAVEALPRTPVITAPTLNVVDAPTIFEAPYLSGLKASFIVTLRPATKKTVTVQFRTLNGSARAGIEYAAKSGTLTFQPGAYSQIVLVDILRDDLKVNTNVPHPRTFFLEIFNAVNAKIGRSRGSAAITENTRRQVGVTISNALPVYEHGTGLKSVFTLTLNHPSSSTVTVKYQTLNGSAIAGQDYMAVSGTATFLPGQTVKTVSVPVFDNNNGKEGIVETFFMKLSSPTNAILLHEVGAAEIAEFRNSSF